MEIICQTNFTTIWIQPVRNYSSSKIDDFWKDSCLDVDSWENNPISFVDCEFVNKLCLDCAICQDSTNDFVFFSVGKICVWERSGNNIEIIFMSILGQVRVKITIM